MDKELAELLEEHFKSGATTRKVPGLRTIPVQSAVDETLQIASYDNAKAVIKKKERIALADCICNQWQQARGGTCKQPKEVCFLFDFYGQYYVDQGKARWLTHGQALEKLEECDKAGLVPQFSNSENPEALCNCCPDCCGGLRQLKRLPKPGLVAPSNHFAQINVQLCSGCETCIDRCPMEGISMEDGAARINLEKCIGCGLCVTTCPDGALSLKLKPEGHRCIPPEKGVFMRPSEDLEGKIRS
jgi:ferredoxin